MPLTYKTSAGDVVDEIACRQYGAGDSATVMMVLNANPGLADYGPTLPAGVTITLPDAPPVTQKKQVSLWD